LATAAIVPKPAITPGGRFSSWLVASALRWVSQLSPKGRTRFVETLTWLAWTCRIRRRVTLENLQFAFPEKSEAERRSIAKRAYRNMTRAAMDAIAPRDPHHSIIERVCYDETWQEIEARLRSGQGVLAATAHFGNWELLGDAVVRQGIPLSVVVRPLTGAFNAHIVEARKKSGLKVILQRGALTPMIQAVRQGELVAQLIDQALPARAAVWVPFFGRLASTTPALSVAALRTGAPVYVVLAIREAEGLRVFAEGPFAVPLSNDRDDDICRHTQMLTEVIERYVRKYPDQWMWLHRRWKSTNLPARRPAIPAAREVGRK
jgi:Kdo2-lipid IVA lauroyltransferase/acyltransferase